MNAIPVSRSDVIKLAKKYNINLHTISINELFKALKEEYEHRDVIHNNPEIAFKIVLAHLREMPDYYKRLRKMVKQADKYWANKTMPNIYN
jgi:hypothetical protein